VHQGSLTRGSGSTIITRYQVLYVILYLFFLINYFYSETGDNFLRRVINKMILASMFFGYGCTVFFLHYELKSIHLLLVTGLALSWLGDLFLLYRFTPGGILFLVGNFFFTG